MFFSVGLIPYHKFSVFQNSNLTFQTKKIYLITPEKQGYRERRKMWQERQILIESERKKLK